MKAERAPGETSSGFRAGIAGSMPENNKPPRRPDPLAARNQGFI